MEVPMNANQLAQALDLDYTTIQHHLGVLKDNGLVTAMGPNYGRTYFVSDKMESFAEAFAGILEKIEGKRAASQGAIDDGH